MSFLALLLSETFGVFGLTILLATNNVPSIPIQSLVLLGTVAMQTKQSKSSQKPIPSITRGEPVE